MEEISLFEYLIIIKKRFWIIFLIMVISISVSVYLNYYYILPTYEASVTMIVGKKEVDRQLQYSDMLLYDKLAKNYKEILKSRKVVKNVIEGLNLDADYEMFLKNTNIISVPDTQVIKIVITHHVPIAAARIANTYAEVFEREAEKIINIDMIDIIDRAVIPVKPVAPKSLLNVSISAVLGLMIGLFLAFMGEFLDKSVKTPEDIQRHFSLPVLGSIPEFKRK